MIELSAETRGRIARAMAAMEPLQASAEAFAGVMKEAMTAFEREAGFLPDDEYAAEERTAHVTYLVDFNITMQELLGGAWERERVG